MSGLHECANECGTVNEEKNCGRARAIQIQNRTRAAKLTVMDEYRQAQRREKHMFRIKKGQLDNQALVEIERHRSVQDSRKFYKRLNDTRKPFGPAVAMCRATNGQLLTNKDQVLSRWMKEYFEQHLNESSECGHTHFQCIFSITCKLCCG
jgi:hypothetical protein